MNFDSIARQCWWESNRIDKICVVLNYNLNRVPKSVESIYKVQAACKSIFICLVNFNFEVYVSNFFRNNDELSASGEIKINQTKLKMWLKFKFSVQSRFYDQRSELISFKHSVKRLQRYVIFNIISTLYVQWSCFKSHARASSFFQYKDARLIFTASIFTVLFVDNEFVFILNYNDVRGFSSTVLGWCIHLFHFKFCWSLRNCIVISRYILKTFVKTWSSTIKRLFSI